jgi:hypothetical protein
MLISAQLQVQEETAQQVKSRYLRLVDCKVPTAGRKQEGQTANEKDQGMGRVIGCVN